MKKHNPTAMIVALILGLLATAGIVHAQQGGGQCSRGAGGGNGMGQGVGQGRQGANQGQGACTANVGTGACVRLNQRFRDATCTNHVQSQTQTQTAQQNRQGRHGGGRR